MRFEIRYPSGERHEVALEGTLATVGRDPSSDLILNDVKCSRRHAVLEAGPQGLAIRDAGSANGVYVNDSRVERSALNAGDLIRLGDVELRVLPEPFPGTVSMEPGEAATVVRPAGWVPLEPPAPSPQLAPQPAVAPLDLSVGNLPLRPVTPLSSITAAPPLPGRRSVTLTVLAVLWMISVPLHLAIGLFIAWRAGGALGAVAAFSGLLVALLGAAMVFGLWTRSPWARVLQLATAGFGIFLCPFAPAAITILIYLLRPVVEAQFATPKTAPRDPSDGLFAVFLLGTVLLGAVLTGGAVFLLAFAGRSVY